VLFNPLQDNTVDRILRNPHEINKQHDILNVQASNPLTNLIDNFFSLKSQYLQPSGCSEIERKTTLFIKNQLKSKRPGKASHPVLSPENS